MRCSIYLATVSFLASFAYGFSSAPIRTSWLPQQRRLATTNKPLPAPSLVGAVASNKASYTASSTFRGGAIQAAASPTDAVSKCPVTGTLSIMGSLWGTGGVLYILAKAITRVLPIALEPFQKGAIPLGQFQLGAYVATCLWFAYVEGYKGFQTKFSPLVVTRSFTLVPGKNGARWYHFPMAPFYSMGLIHATKKRKIVSWSVSIGVAGIVAAVKRLPYPYRNIIDAGVVTGLTWGSVSILFLYLKAWITGQPPVIDAALPEVKE